MSKAAPPVQVMGEGWQVPKVTTPEGNAMCVPTEALAVRISQEWHAYHASIVSLKTSKATKTASTSSKAKSTPADAMPMYCLAVTAIDRLNHASQENQREACIHHLAKYIENELFCHRADAPPSLVARQARVWQPWLDWAEAEYAVRLIPHTGLMPARQPAASIARVRALLAGMDDFALAATQQLASLGGSLVASLAVVARYKTASEAFTASFLDELWQAEQWGSDLEAVARRALIKKRMEEAERFLHLLQEK